MKHQSGPYSQGIYLIFFMLFDVFRACTSSSTTTSSKLFVLARFMHLDVQGLTARFASPHSRLKCDWDSFTKDVQIVLHRAPESRGQKRSRNVARSLCDMTVVQETGGGEMHGLDCFLQPKVSHSPLGLFSLCVWWGWCENITSKREKKEEWVSLCISPHAGKESLDYYSKSVIVITVGYYHHRYCFLS